MESIEIVLAMLLAVIISGYLVRVLPFSLPLPLAQIGLGAVIAGVSSRGVKLDPPVFFLLFLPPLLFLDGWSIPKDGLLRDKGVIIQLALGLVVFTLVGMGFLIHWMIPAMPLAVAFALAAIVSPTDPVALSSIAARVPIPKRLIHILEGESLLNDATGLVCFRFALTAAVTGSFSLGSASLTFLWVALAGLAIGVGFTLAVGVASRWLSHHIGEESGSSILISLLIPFGAYLLSEMVHASGILAAVSAGISMSYLELTGRVAPTTRLQRKAVWNTVEFALNGIVFVLLGEQLPSILRDAVLSVEQSGHFNPWWLAAYALAINIGLLLLRFVWVVASLGTFLFKAYRRGDRLSKSLWRLVLATSLAGVRGAITLAGVLTLPLLLPDGSPFPARELAVFLAAAAILLSLLIASLGLPWLLNGLDLPEESSQHVEEDRARDAAAVAGIAAITKAQATGPHNVADADAYVQAAALIIALYRYRLAGRDMKSGAEQEHKTDVAERELRLTGLAAEREEILNLARQASISDATARKLVQEIDLVELRYH